MKSTISSAYPFLKRNFKEMMEISATLISAIAAGMNRYSALTKGPGKK